LFWTVNFNNLRENEKKRLDSVTAIPINLFNGRIKFDFGFKDTNSFQRIRIKYFRMRRLAGPCISAAKWNDIRFHITGQWVSLFYLPEKQTFQALFYEHVPC